MRASKGEGRPYQRSADGRWVVVVRDVAGRRKYLYGWSRDEVIEKRDDWNAGVRMGLTPAPRTLTVGKHLKDWLADRRGKVRSSTWIDYEAHVRIHLADLARIPLAKLTPNDVRRLLRGRLEVGCSPSLARKTLTILRMALGQAVDDGLVPRNVAKVVDPPDVATEPIRILTPAECRRLLAVDHPLRPLWALLLGTGLRLGEALGLRSTDIDWTRRTLRVQQTLRSVDRRVRVPGTPRLVAAEPKTETSRRTIVMPGFVVDALAELEPVANVQRYIFTTPRGTPLDQRNVARAWTGVAAQGKRPAVPGARDLAGIPAIRIHDLRHTAASLMLAQGASLHDVMKALGHSSIAMTANTYGHLVEGRSAELADGMDRAIGGA